jgi:hypothetical protein
MQIRLICQAILFGPSTALVLTLSRRTVKNEPRGCLVYLDDIYCNKLKRRYKVGARCSVKQYQIKRSYKSNGISCRGDKDTIKRILYASPFPNWFYKIIATLVYCLTVRARETLGPTV